MSLSAIRLTRVRSIIACIALSMGSETKLSINDFMLGGFTSRYRI